MAEEAEGSEEGDSDSDSKFAKKGKESASKASDFLKSRDADAVSKCSRCK